MTKFLKDLIKAFKAICKRKYQVWEKEQRRLDFDHFQSKDD